MSDVKKKYYVINGGSEGYSKGTIFLTEAEAELINKVSNKENWDTIIEDDNDYEGSTHVELVEEDNCSVTNQKLAVYEEIVNSGNCNVCGKRSTCEYCPKLGELIRYNCPLYERKKEE